VFLTRRVFFLYRGIPRQNRPKGAAVCRTARIREMIDAEKNNDIVRRKNVGSKLVLENLILILRGRESDFEIIG